MNLLWRFYMKTQTKEIKVVNYKFDSNDANLGCGMLMGILFMAIFLVVVLGTFGGALFWLIWNWCGVGVAVGAPEPIATLGFWHSVGLVWCIRILLPIRANYNNKD